MCAHNGSTDQAHCQQLGYSYEVTGDHSVPRFAKISSVPGRDVQILFHKTFSIPQSQD